MRISDWTSEECSSDLRRHSLRVSAHAGLWLSFSGRSTRFADTLRHLPAAAGRYRDVGTLAASLPAVREEPTCTTKTKTPSTRPRTARSVQLSTAGHTNEQQTTTTRYTTDRRKTP